MGAEENAPISRETLCAALNAMHEAFGMPVTRCADLNRVLREFPDANAAAIALLLQDHDAGKCLCADSSTRR